VAFDHFEKEHHQAKRADWNFNILFDGQPAVTDMAREYREAIRHPSLYDPIPPKWLHATIFRVGLVDDYTEHEMLAVAARLEPLLKELRLPEFCFDSWWLWGGNVVLHISPDDKFTQIYDQVIAALNAVVGQERIIPTPHGRFIAHTGLAFTKTHDKESEINSQLVNTRIKPASFRARRLSLIKQWPINGHYEWEVVRQIPIGQALQNTKL
jgi:2'-5' RNA ligase